MDNLDELELVEIKVGAQFDFKERKSFGDGAYFENLGNGMWMQTIYLNHIQQSEIDAIEKETPQFRYVKQDDYILPLIGYEGNFTFEMEFDPTLYLSNNINITFEDIKSSNLMTIVLIEGTTNIVKLIKSVSIPIKLFDIMMASYENAFRIDNFSNGYKQWIDKLRMLNQIQLWELAVRIK